MASLLTGKELEQLGSFTGRLYPNHCGTVDKTKFSRSFHRIGVFYSFGFGMYCLEKAAKIEKEPFSISKNVSVHVDVSQSHVSNSPEMACERGVY